MFLIKDSINIKELGKIADKQFAYIIKAVVDIDKGIMVIGGSLHADEENLLVEKEQSKSDNIWGINLHFQNFPKENWIEFDSIINLKPSCNNRSRGVDNIDIRKKIRQIVKKLIVR